MIEWYVNELKILNVDVQYNVEVIANMIRENGVDVVIIGDGTIAVIPRIPGIEKDTRITSVEALLNQKPVKEKDVVGDGGLVGYEAAMKLYQERKQVPIMETLPKLMSAGIATPLLNALCSNAIRSSD